MTDIAKVKGTGPGGKHEHDLSTDPAHPTHYPHHLATVRHFDDAMSTARKSVSKSELARYLKYKQETAGA